MKKRLIIDGENLLYRSFWVLSEEEREKHPSLYVKVFLNTLRSYVKIFNPTEIIVTWDSREEGFVNERKEILEDYKGNRSHPKEVHEFVPKLKDILTSLGIKQLHPRKREADDILYWLCAKKYPNECVLISTDTDMYQLVIPSLRENTVWNPTKKEVVDSTYLLAHYNVNDGNEFIIKKALRGDKSDNIDGIKGLRSTKIDKIIEVLGKRMNFTALKKSNLLSEEQIEIFQRNLKLMKLDSILKVEDEIEFYKEQLKESTAMNYDDFERLVGELELKQILDNVYGWFNSFDLSKNENTYQRRRDSYSYSRPKTKKKEDLNLVPDGKGGFRPYDYIDYICGLRQ